MIVGRMHIKSRRRLFLAFVLPLICSCAGEPDYDLLVRGGTVYDGTGGAGFAGDVAIKGDRIASVGPKAPGKAKREIDATGLAVAPGFINMLSLGRRSRCSIDGRARATSARASRSR